MCPPYSDDFRSFGSAHDGKHEANQFRVSSFGLEDYTNEASVLFFGENDKGKKQTR